jgi:hypothetical protein
MSLFQTPAASPLGFAPAQAGGLPGGGGLLGGIPPVGSNPLNPLQGQPAVSGIGQFIAQIQTTSALRRLGLLPSGRPGAAAGGLGALLGGGGAGGFEALIGPLLQQFMAMAAAQGGAAPPPAAAQPQGLNILA